MHVLKLTGVDYIIRLDAVDERYPGGREALIEEHAKLLGKRVFFDEDLIIFHPLNGVTELRLWDNYYEEKGLVLTERIPDLRVARDRVYTSAQTGWSDPCDWLGVNEWDLTCWFWKENYHLNNPLRDYYHWNKASTSGNPK